VTAAAKRQVLSDLVRLLRARPHSETHSEPSRCEVSRVHSTAPGFQRALGVTVQSVANSLNMRRQATGLLAPLVRESLKIQRSATVTRTIDIEEPRASRLFDDDVRRTRTIDQDLAWGDYTYSTSGCRDSLTDQWPCST
jgi:hypothetical protein